MTEETILINNEENANNPEEWIKALATYFSKGKLQGFFEKENCSKIILGSVGDKDLAREIAEGLISVVSEIYREDLPKPEPLPFRIDYGEAKKTEERKILFGGRIKEKIPASGIYDIFVEKI